MEIAEALRAFPQIVDAFVFCVGACVGSFLNVCIYRIPKGESIVTPPSHCACGKPIPWYFNLPIIGWLILGGRARCCGRRISPRYPFVETLTAAIFLILWLTMPPWTAFAGMVFSSLMIFCTFVDIDTMTLPDFATVGGAIVGVALSAVIPDMHNATIVGAPFFASSMASIIAAVVGAAAGSGVLYWVRLLGEYVFKREAMGEGDVILVGCIGAFCGWQGALFAIFGGSVIGCVLIVPVLLAARLFKKKPDGEKKKDGGQTEPLSVPFGPWLAIGGALYYVFLSPAVDAYFEGVAQMFFGI